MAVFLDSSESESDAEFEETILLFNMSKRKKSFWKSDYMKKRSTHGEFALSSEFSDPAYLNYFRLSRKQVDEVHNLIENSIYSDGCNAQKPIGTKEKLAVFLRYIGSGDSYRSIAYSYRMGDRTVAKIVNEISVAIWTNMQPLYLAKPTTEMWKAMSLDFEKKWHFPHCVGAVDGKHIVIQKPPKTGSSYYNYKQHCSIVLMATVDANYKFTTIDVGSMGRFSDGNIFSSSPLGKRMMRKTLGLPHPTLFSTAEVHLPYVFVGDEAFPLTENLMRPYPRRSVIGNGNLENKIFNYRLSRARQCVECAFGILASRFRVFRKPFEIKVESVVNVTKAACVLHNYLRGCKEACNHVDGTNTELPTSQLLSLRNNNIRSTSNAFLIRQNFTQYFNTEGQIPWQESSVLQGKF
ncbi:uncharacterized protein LOC126889520 [Diabrotica virgifera virgifera]|uniref:DDE Tnp4 domain-containing protein n=1 Tax=Diabrotica virgifera virgifera TaxID=50390 RepID=A0ABM5KUF2_DIAVI|nr:uncharacterized protein LOC126883026 [Diabrotica virgifera virgifera]XP_050513817.1 uncharacterized protein LOC126889520 [Diabrotica virgifera virgifera]